MILALRGCLTSLHGSVLAKASPPESIELNLEEQVPCRSGFAR